MGLLGIFISRKQSNLINWAVAEAPIIIAPTPRAASTRTRIDEWEMEPINGAPRCGAIWLEYLNAR